MRFFEKRPLPPSVPIVPMIDILTILLIFFIVNSQWKKPRNLLEIDIPSVEYLKAAKEVKPRVTLSVGRDSRVAFNGETLEMDRLATELKQFRRARPDAELEMEVDRKIPLETMIKVWDALTEAGIEVKTVPALIEIQGEKATDK